MTEYEIDFLSIEKTGEAGSKSGDAIAMRFLDPLGIPRVVVIDGGYKDAGERLVEHIPTYYGTTHVDLVISTHPDADHINGLATVMEKLTVGELLIHRPHDHAADVSEYSNIEVIDAVIALAEDNDVPVVEPFTGLTRFNGAIRILGPAVGYYEDLLAEYFSTPEDKSLSASAGMFRHGGVLAKAVDLLDRALSYLPLETLSEDGYTGPRNQSSVITLLTVGSERMLFTGDAGIEALERACEEYEAVVGPFMYSPLGFIQAPHHGSHRNVSPTLLNRILGKPGDTFGTSTAFISSAKADPKHPSPKVTNAFKRRDVGVFATEGKGLLHADAVTRPGWVAAPQVPPLEEDVD